MNAKEYIDKIQEQIDKTEATEIKVITPNSSKAYDKFDIQCVDGVIIVKADRE